MIALILHPTEELLIANEQKKILRFLNSSSINHAKPQQHDNSHNAHSYIPEYPLWILLDNENDKNENKIEKIFDNNLFKNKNETLKTLRKKIQPIKIYNWKESSGKLFFPVELTYADDTETKKLYGKIMFGKTLHVTSAHHVHHEHHEHHAPFSPSTITVPDNDIFLLCKIFRIAYAEICVSSQGGKTWQVQQSVWVKT